MRELNHLSIARWATIASLLLSLSALTLSLSRAPHDIVAGTETRHMLEALRKDKVLRVGYVVNDPQVIRDAKTGALSGYHVDLISRIAADAGLDLEFHETTFSTMTAGLGSAAFDVVIGGGYTSIPRAREVCFTDPLMYLALGYIARADDERFHSEADLHKPGLRIAVTAGGASADFVKHFLPEATPIILARNELAKIALEVASGRADVGIGNINNCVRFERDQPSLKYVTQGKPFFKFGSSFVVRHGDPDWLNFLNVSLRVLHTNGYSAALEARYNPDGTLWIPIEPGDRSE